MVATSKQRPVSGPFFIVRKANDLYSQSFRSVLSEVEVKGLPGGQDSPLQMEKPKIVASSE